MTFKERIILRIVGGFGAGAGTGVAFVFMYFIIRFILKGCVG